MATILARPSAATAASPFRPSTIELNEREQKRYSLGRAILSHVERIESGERASSFELEISDELARKLTGDVKKHGGLFVPWSIRIDPSSAQRARIQLRAGLDSKTTTRGSELVLTEPQSFIEFLYNRMVRQGARRADALRTSGKHRIPEGFSVRHDPDAFPVCSGADVSESNLTLGQVTMTSHTYQSSTSYSRQLLAQSASIVDIDNLVRVDLATDSALSIDKAALIGDGTGGSPTGILSTTGTQAYTMAADSGAGGKPAYADILGMEELIDEANADGLGSFGWVTVPSIKALLRQTPIVANTIALPVWQSGDTMGDTMDGYPARITNQLPKNLTKSTGTALTLLILGIWSQMIVGMWGSGYCACSRLYSPFHSSTGQKHVMAFVPTILRLANLPVPKHGK